MSMKRLFVLGFVFAVAGCSPKAVEVKHWIVANDRPASVGFDKPPAKLERMATAVILFGRGGEAAEELRFVPVLCLISGRLATGKECGLAMPPEARVRITRQSEDGPVGLTLARTTKDFHDDAGGRDYVAPTGPACCMYNTCIEETIPYLTSANALVPSRVLAVWPETADVDLEPRHLGRGGGNLNGGPWADDWGMTVEQNFCRGGECLVSTRGPCGSCGALWVRRGGGFKSVKGIGIGADGFDILATSDIDGDGHPEAIVYEVWRNDYGLHVLGNDWSKPAYRFNCGNI
jgi:hypothetical protein